MTRDEVNGDFGRSKIMNVRFIELIEVHKSPRLIDSLPGLSQQIAYLFCATLADRENHLHAAQSE